MSRFYLGYLHVINHSSASSHRPIAQTCKNCSHQCQGVCYRLVLPVAQVWARQAPAQERRAPTIGAALLPTCSGPATTRLLSYDAVMVGRAQKRPCRGAATEGVPARKMGPLVSIRAFSDGYHGESIEHSQMDTRESPSSIL